MNVRGLKARAGRPGFTLAEVMIAMVLTSMVVLGSWRFFGSAANSMSVFSGMAIVDERLALAADLLSSDARRAGMFGTPQSDNDPMVCPKPADELRAVIVQDDASLPVYSWGANAFVDPDVCIFQAPATTTIFNPVSIAGDTITLPADPIELPNEAFFDDLFTDRTLRISTPGGFSQFVVVSDPKWGDDADNTRELEVTPNPTMLQDNGFCGVEGIGGPDHEITVLTNIRYQLIEDPDDAERILLVREELDPTLTTIKAGTRLVVAENIVDLQCWGDEDQGGGLLGPDFADDDALGDFTGTAADIGATSNTTEQLRVLHWQISARTDREFNSHRHIPRTSASDLLSTFDVDGDAETAALVITSGQRVELSNLVIRRLQ